MAKKRPRAASPRRERTVEYEAPAAELSLEEILEEYRSWQAVSEPEPENVSETPAHSVVLEPEEDLATAELTAEEPEAEPLPAPEETAVPPAPVPEPEPEKKAAVPAELLEGYDEEDDFYAGVSTELPPTEEEKEPEPAFEPEDGEEEEEESDDRPFFRPRGKKTSAIRHASPERGKTGILGKLVGLLAAASLRAEQRRSQPPPEPEDAAIEMEPRQAARHYAGQMPALRLRGIGAAGVFTLIVWITLSCGFGWPLPGGLESNIRAAALVCLTGQITVMLLGLDVVTSGFMSLLRGRPGAESLIVVAGIASALETLVLVVTGNTSRGLPFTALSAGAVVFALWGAWLTGRAYYDSFMTCFRIKEPTVVTSEELPDMDERGLISSRREAAGFIRRSEEPGPAESLAGNAFLPMAAVSLALSLAVALGSGDPGAFFHLLSLLTGLCAAWGWLYAYPLLFAKTARHLLYNGAAVAGWSGAAQMGRSRRLVLTDTDIFPEDAVEITGIRILDKTDAEHVISCTGSMLAAAGTGTAAVFTELMRMHGAALRQVEDFTVGEGGARGSINGAEIRVGTSGYMHLSAVKIPDRLHEDDALYTAINGELAGVFLFRYRASASVQRALYALRRARRKPIFAVRDFNVDPFMLLREFGVSTEGFQFPAFPDRYRISGISTSGDSPVAGILGQEGLEPLTDLYESGTALYQIGRVCAWACLACAILGAVLAVVPGWSGDWAALSAARMLIFHALWLLPGIVGAILLKK